jgi:hypothetical protein
MQVWCQLMLECGQGNLQVQIRPQNLTSFHKAVDRLNTRVVDESRRASIA